MPIIIPHFGAGLFREALMVADLCPNVLLDTSSSNGWIRYHPGLTLADVFRRALDVVGPDRLLFGSDSSFFPRGWVKDVYAQQSAALDEVGRECGGAGEDLQRQLREDLPLSRTKTQAGSDPLCGSDPLSADRLKRSLRTNKLIGVGPTRRVQPRLLASVRERLEVFAQQVSPEVAVEVAPHRVDVVAVVLGVVVFDEEGRTLDPVVVLLAAFGLAGPREANLLDAGLSSASPCRSAAMSAAIFPV